MSYDYNLEMKLRSDAPDLHRIFTDNVLCCQNMLNKYKSVFPNYTDHTALHSLEVIAFCNELVADNIDKINTDEIFILLMSAYLHDSGMGITESDYLQFTEEIEPARKFINSRNDVDIVETIRRFHNEYSGKYIEKYASLFDFPSEEHLFSIIQTSRGHRKTDLSNETEYPSEILLSDGNIVHLPYLAALIRMADELDIAADRNIQFLYNVDSLSNEESKMEFKKHMAVKSLRFDDDALTVCVHNEDPEVENRLNELFDKLADTFEQCSDVIKYRTPFNLKQKCIRIERI